MMNIQLPFFDFLHTHEGILRIYVEGKSGSELKFENKIRFNLSEEGRWRKIYTERLKGDYVWIQSTIRGAGDFFKGFFEQYGEQGIDMRNVKMEVVIEGIIYEVVAYGRPRNPDGTINHTKMELK